MAIDYRYYRAKWIYLCILTVGLGAFLWAYARGEAKAEPGVVPFVVSLAVIGHIGLVTLMIRAKRREEKEAQVAFTAMPAPTSAPVAEKNAWNRELSPRAVGIVLLVCGLVLGYIGVIMPMQEAAAHAASVSLSLKGVLFVPLLFVSGALYALAPSWTVRFAGYPPHMESKAWILHGPLLALGLALYFYLKHVVEGYGYVIT